MTLLIIRAMADDDGNTRWTIDLRASLARRGEVEIHFAPASGSGVALTFVRGGDLSLERQCWLAGEALEAISRATHRR